MGFDRTEPLYKGDSQLRQSHALDGRGSAEQGAEPSGYDEVAMAAHVAALEKTGFYRVLRRPPPIPGATGSRDGAEAVGVVVDLETTGLDPGWDEPIELAMVAFRYDRGSGRLLGVVDTFSALAEPSIPIPAAVTRLTGISATDVKGCSIDAAHVAAFVEPANIVIAHNAKFDRAFAEEFWPTFEAKAWACSCTGVDCVFRNAKLGLTHSR